MHFMLGMNYLQLQMVLEDGMKRESIQENILNFYVVRKENFKLGAQVYYHQNPQFYDENPLELIVKAQKKNNKIGSSTMVVLTLNQKYLRSCYIGGNIVSIIYLDSGFIVIRVFNSKPMVIYRFTQQQHSFNFPFQLSLQKYNGDDPLDSICINLKIKQGDIIVAGSDGLFDNIFVDEMLITIQDYLMSQKDSIFELAKLFSEQAMKRGENKKFKSPFSQRAKQLGIQYEGGKLDDTTVIIAQIDKKQNQEEKYYQL